MSLPVDPDDLRDEFSQSFEWMRNLAPFIEAMGEDRLRVQERLRAEFGIRTDHPPDEPGMRRLLIACRQCINGLDDQKSAKRLVIDLVVGTILARSPGVPGRLPDAATAPDATILTTAPLPAAAGRSPGPGAGRGSPREVTGARPPAARLIRAFCSHPLDPPRMPVDPVDLPVRLFELLPPAPPESCGKRELALWAAGNLWATDALAIGFDLPSEDGLERLAEAENEIHSAPGPIFARQGLFPRQAQGSTARALEFLDVASRDAGIFAATADRAAALFRDAYADVLGQVAPGKLEDLARRGASLRFGEELAFALAGAWDLETRYLCETGELRTGRVQDLRGALSPEADLTTGLVFRRAAFQFLGSGTPLPVALRETVLEFRYAQVLRGLDDAQIPSASANFDKVFQWDCTATLDAYRIANKELEPSF